MRTLTKDNFDSIYEWEEWLSEEAGATMYAKSMRRLTHLSKSFGVELRPEFMAQAKATSKRRQQQADYEAAKEEARLAKITEAQEGLTAVAESDDLEAIEAALAAALEAGVPEGFEGWGPARAAKAECERKAAQDASSATKEDESAE